jgi:hypothetical protein
MIISGGGLIEPTALALEQSGSILLADWRTWIGDPTKPSAILRIDPTTGTQTMLSSGGSLNLPFDVVVVAPEPALTGVCAFALAAMLPRRRQAVY